MNVKVILLLVLLITIVGCSTKQLPLPCSNLQILQRNDCYADLARNLSDASLCSKIDYPFSSSYDANMIQAIHQRNMCYADLAKSLNNISICTQIDHEEKNGLWVLDYRLTCYSNFFLSDPEICNYVKGNFWKPFGYKQSMGYSMKSLCYNDVALHMGAAGKNTSSEIIDVCKKIILSGLNTSGEYDLMNDCILQSSEPSSCLLISGGCMKSETSEKIGT
ncbi:MAG: hypothetical protein V1702_00695 [Candidatus Woesearchaeota archaeon]